MLHAEILIGQVDDTNHSRNNTYRSWLKAVTMPTEGLFASRVIAKLIIIAPVKRVIKDPSATIRNLMEGQNPFFKMPEWRLRKT